MTFVSFIFDLVAVAIPWNQRRPGFFDFLERFWNGTGGDVIIAMSPLAAIALWWHFSGRYRRAEARRRQIEAPRAKCFNCGYDLRSTRHRCPECGMPVTVLTSPDHAGVPPNLKGPHVARDYYVRIGDSTYWVIETAGGNPVKAIGPLAHERLKTDPASLDFSAAIDATSWNMIDFTRTREADRLKLIRGLAGRQTGREEKQDS